MTQSQLSKVFQIQIENLMSAPSQQQIFIVNRSYTAAEIK